MSHETRSTKVPDVGVILDLSRRKPSHSSSHQDHNLSLMSWNDKYNGRPGSASSASNDDGFISSKKHDPSYAGAGHFWEPSDGNAQRHRIFSQTRSTNPVALSQSYDVTSSVGQLSLQPTFSHPSTQSSCLPSRSEDAESLPSDLSAGVSSISRDGDFPSRIPDSIAFDHNAFLREANDQTLAQRIANDDRRRKTVQHLQRLHELEEDKVAQLHGFDDFAEGICIDRSVGCPSRTEGETQLPKALRLNFAVPKNTPDTKVTPPIPGSHEAFVPYNVSTNRGNGQALLPNPERSSHTEPHPAESLSLNYHTPAIVIRAPTQKAKAPARTALPKSSSSSLPVELSTVSPYSDHDDLGRNKWTDVYESGLYVTDIEQNETGIDIDSTLEVSPMGSKETLPQVLLPPPRSNPEIWGRTKGNPSHMDVVPQVESLFAGLQHLKQSLPSRNMNPQLLTKPSASYSSPSRPSPPFLSKPSVGIEMSLPASVETKNKVLQEYCELSTSASVAHKHLAHNSVPPSYRELYESPTLDNIEHRKKTFAARNIRRGPPANNGGGIDELEVAEPRTTFIDIEPDVDPRTGRTYVGVSGPTSW